VVFDPALHRAEKQIACCSHQVEFRLFHDVSVFVARSVPRRQAGRLAGAAMRRICTRWASRQPHSDDSAAVHIGLTMNIYAKSVAG
jgi:hypothetical protein